MDRTLHHHAHKKSDGRILNLYSWNDIRATSLPENEEYAGAPGHSQMRWHPLRNEWVVYSAARQNRTFKPPANLCPLCPVQDGMEMGEIPFTAFDVAVFDNRFPAFKPDTTEALPHPFLKTAPAQGKCEVVIYTSQHQGSIGELPQERVELLVEAWNHRYNALRGKDGIKFVMPFENRGEEAGVTLHHPHGQIYAFPYTPPIQEQAVKSFRQGKVLTNFIENKRSSDYVIFGDSRIMAFVPPFARYPYEVWVAARRSVPGPWAFDFAEKSSFAEALRRVVTLYDKFFTKTAPYVYSMHAAPYGEDEYFEFSAQFYPLLRAPGRMKFLAGCEQGAGTFLSDIPPETAAEQLRGVL